MDFLPLKVETMVFLPFKIYIYIYKRCGFPVNFSLNTIPGMDENSPIFRLLSIIVDVIVYIIMQNTPGFFSCSISIIAPEMFVLDRQPSCPQGKLSIIIHVKGPDEAVLGCTCTCTRGGEFGIQLNNTGCSRLPSGKLT